eukprot:TRINITY_DN56129_c0_g1_i1.p1 TRINITY_DN56129_c0_g1~~TRINITY_DN56129_c0_g1_i1.p1  ORF type:complete len:305 (-),score=44.29 TRINITY_DN56129_c0_g1_i1:650-1522(-)
MFANSDVLTTAAFGSQEDNTGAGLWLGDESLVSDSAALKALGITHRLQCNMRERDARVWMATQWDCDCPGCPRQLSNAAAAMATALNGTGSEDGEIEFDEKHDSDGVFSGVPPPPQPLPVQLELSLVDRGSVEAGGVEAGDRAFGHSSGAIVHAYLPLFDDDPFARTHSAPLLRAGARFIHEALDDEHGRVYVHCEKGCSRSASVVVQYLVEFRGFSLIKAASMLKSRRCRVSPSAGFVEALAANEREQVGETDTAALASVSDVVGVFRRSWLADFRAGRVKPKPVDRII